VARAPQKSRVRGPDHLFGALQKVLPISSARRIFLRNSITTAYVFGQHPRFVRDDGIQKKAANCRYLDSDYRAEGSGRLGLVACVAHAIIVRADQC
jgi:hypothetical protein